MPTPYAVDVAGLRKQFKVRAPFLGGKPQVVMLFPIFPSNLRAVARWALWASRAAASPHWPAC